MVEKLSERKGEFEQVKNKSVGGEALKGVEPF
jgi:hypothetical protein